MENLTSVELCAGGGGQALGLEKAGFHHRALVEIDNYCSETLKLNRPHWNVYNKDIREWNAEPFHGVDLLAAGVPCPPFSVAGQKLGKADERDLFPTVLDIVERINPKAVIIENVKGILDPVFEDYRFEICMKLRDLGYLVDYRLLQAADFGVSQLRPRVVFVAIKEKFAHGFSWPEPLNEEPQSVGETLYDLMGANGWLGAKDWKEKASRIAPTIVGGSKKHGGPDLGPVRAKRAWAELGVDGKGLADEAPQQTFDKEGIPRLTVQMVARLQGFPDDWEFYGRKTASYRQVGNAFPAPVAEAVGRQIMACLTSEEATVKDFDQFNLERHSKQVSLFEVTGL